MSSHPGAELWKGGSNLEKLVRPFYIDLSYYNISHPRMVARAGREAALKAIQFGAEIDLDALDAAAYFHDAFNFFTPGVEHPFDTAEEYAADIAGMSLGMVGMPKPKISLTQRSILSTNPDRDCKNDNDRALAQGDLNNLIQPALVFFNATYRLYRDDRWKKHEAVPSYIKEPGRLQGELIDYGVKCRPLLDQLLQKDLSLGSHDRDKNGRSLFVAKAQENVKLLERRTLSRIIPEMLDKIISYQPAAA
jgi:hypothetical protein